MNNNFEHHMCTYFLSCNIVLHIPCNRTAHVNSIRNIKVERIPVTINYEMGLCWHDTKIQ